MREKIKIQDDSGDKKYFTIIPNYILNHSTLWDREVYIQMKRITGEDGTCWTSRTTLSKQCGISARRLDKSLKYLTEHKWIETIGKKEVLTKGGLQLVNEYKVCDLWNKNNEFYQDKYKGVAPETIPKGVARNEQRGSTDDVKGIAHGAYKEEPYINKNHIKKNQALSLKNTFTEFENVKLTEEELQKLETKLGKNETIALMEELGTYIASTGRRYSSHYATLLNWARRKGINYKSKKITVI